MGLKNFRTEDFNNNNKDGDAVKTAASKHDRRVQSSEPQPTSTPIVSPGANPEDVPTGTTPEVLAWVGEDPVRAQKALDTELEDTKPRKGLVEQLSGLIDAEAEDESKSDDLEPVDEEEPEDE